MNKRAKLERMADYEELDKDIEARHCMFALKKESDFVLAGQNVCKKTLEVQVSMRHWNFKRITIISV